MKPIQDAQKVVAELLAEHQHKASSSPYDMKVAVLAIGAASTVIKAINDECVADTDVDAYLHSLIERLTQLRENYYDSDGEYSSGKGEIGSLLGDIYYLQQTTLASPSESLGVTEANPSQDQTTPAELAKPTKPTKPSLSPRFKAYLWFALLYGAFVVFMLWD